MYCFTVNALSKQKCAMRRGMRNPHGLKVRRYSACLVDLNEYLAVLPVDNISEMFCVMDPNEKFLNSMTNSWISQAYV